MVYDVDMHIPGQVDFLLMSYDNKNFAGINSSLETLVDLVKDDGFKSDIKNYETEYNNKIKAIEDDSLKLLKQVKSLDDAVSIINDSHGRMNDLYNDYHKIIKSYVIGYFKKIE